MAVVGGLPTAIIIVVRVAICAIVAFFGGYWIMSGLFSRQISGGEAVLLVSGLLAVLFFAISLAIHGWLGILLILAVLFGMALMFRGLAQRADRGLAARLDEEEIAKYRAALEVDPDNVAAHSLMGDTYRRIGQLEQAIEEYEAALSLDPSLRQERYWLERTRAELESGGRRELLCPRCRAVRPAGASTCPECGRWYSSVEVWKHGLRFADPARKAVWCGVGIGAIGTMAAITIAAPGAMKLMVLMVVFLAPIAIMIMSARARRGTG